MLTGNSIERACLQENTEQGLPEGIAIIKLYSKSSIDSIALHMQTSLI